jgi:exodeoxyribonuclease-3
MLTLVTWNVNSVRARLPRLLPWMERRRPDVVLLQEIKCVDADFPREPFEALGYHSETYGQKTYNGVAILSRAKPDEVWRGLPGTPEEERRVMGARFGDLSVIDVYVVNGEAVGSPKYAYKLEWMAKLREHLRERHASARKLVVAGDFNVTFDDLDVHDPAAWQEQVLCSTPEREALRGIVAVGLTDSFRKFHQDGGHYTWWDFRTRGFQRGDGLRIDHVLASPAAVEACRGVEIDVEARAGEKPSDHAPVVAMFD